MAFPFLSCSFICDFKLILCKNTTFLINSLDITIRGCYTVSVSTRERARGSL